MFGGSQATAVGLDVQLPSMSMSQPGQQPAAGAAPQQVPSMASPGGPQGMPMGACGYDPSAMGGVANPMMGGGMGGMMNPMMGMMNPMMAMNPMAMMMDPSSMMAMGMMQSMMMASMCGGGMGSTGDSGKRKAASAGDMEDDDGLDAEDVKEKIDEFVEGNKLDESVKIRMTRLTLRQALRVMGLSGDDNENTFLLKGGVKNPNAVVMARIRRERDGE